MTDPCPQYQKTHVYIDYYMSVVGDPNPITQTIKAGDFIDLLKDIESSERGSFLNNYTFDIYHFPEMHEKPVYASEFTKNRYNMDGDELLEYFVDRNNTVIVGNIQRILGVGTCELRFSN